MQPLRPQKRIRPPFDERVLALSIKLQKKHPSEEGWKISTRMRVKLAHQMMPFLFPEHPFLAKKFREFAKGNGTQKEKEIGRYFIQKNGGDKVKATGEILTLLKELPSRREKRFGSVEKISAFLRVNGTKIGLTGNELERYVDHSIQNILLLEQLAESHLDCAQNYITQDLC